MSSLRAQAVTAVAVLVLLMAAVGSEARRLESKKNDNDDGRGPPPFYPMSVAAMAGSPDDMMCASAPPLFGAGGLLGVAHAYNNNGLEMKYAERRYDGMASQLRPIGWHQEMIAAASDALDKPELIMDGMSGDVDFPFCEMTPILTIGEYDTRSGYMPPGPPDGQGVYAPDLNTLRFVFQAESYGHLPGRSPSWYFPVNGGNASFTGSHVSYVDYDRSKLRSMMGTGIKGSGISVPGMVKGAGSMIEHVVNLAGKAVDAGSNPHYGDCAADGAFVTEAEIKDVWTMHSLCSAHVIEANQWGDNLGVQDDMFLTNEEWTNVNPEMVAAHGFVGLSSHAIDMATKTAYAIGGWGQGGYEKVVEFNCGSTAHVCYAVSGYNGNFGGDVYEPFVERRKAVSATRSDGTEWVYPHNIVPSRVFVGVKNMTVGGESCADDCTFLERNGLAYGKVYGFAVPSDAEERDAWHKGNDRTQAETVSGVFAPTSWMWDGVVRDFEHDIAWNFQEAPTTHPDYKFWTGAGRDVEGKKTEHVSPDPRGGHRFLQGSTAGYMGIYDMPDLAEMLSGLEGAELPEFIPSTYELIEGEVAINGNVMLGGKGYTASGGDQTVMNDGMSVHSTFEDIDGLEWIAAAGGRDFILVHEDGGNVYGERMVMCEVPPAGEVPTYYFLAMAGGKANTRAMANVCIPAATSDKSGSSEFSGGSDMSGALTQEVLGGHARRLADMEVDINAKLLSISLQAHHCDMGILDAFGLDRGGQVYALQPKLPEDMPTGKFATNGN